MIGRSAPQRSNDKRGSLVNATVVSLALGASLAAAGLTPLAQPAALRVIVAGGVFCTLLLHASLGSVGHVGWLAVAAIAVLIPTGGTPVLLVAMMLVTLSFCRPRPNDAAFAGPVAALLAGSLRHSFDPGLFDIVPGSLVELFVIPGWVGAEMSPAVYGAFLLPVGAASIATSHSRALPRVAGCALLIAALVRGRVQGSALPGIAATLVIPGLLAGFGAAWSRDTGLSPRRRVIVTSAATVLMFATALVVLFVSSSRATETVGEASRTIGIVGAMQGTFEPGPRPGPGQRPRARFGAFKAMLERQGWKCEYLRSAETAVPSGSLAACDAFVTINFSGPDAAAFVAPIREAVSRGARLLVLADHTNLFGQMDVTNGVLTGSGISLMFNSVVSSSASGGWYGAIQVGRDPLFGPHRRGRGIEWGVGCSLKVQSPARTLALATGAFSDKGDPKNSSGIDNLRRDADERLGGLAIAAVAPLGEGSVLVFGDTSAVQDGSLESGGEFASRVAAWLAGLECSNDVPGQRLAATTAFLTLLALAWLGFAPMHRMLAALALLLAVLEGFTEEGVRKLPHVRDAASPEILIDLDSMPSVHLGQAPDSPYQIFQEASHCGLLGRFRQPGETPDSRDVLVFLDPTRPSGDEDATRLITFLEQGGRVVLFLGPRGAQSMAPLLRRLRLELGVPLGRGQPESAWLVNVDDDVPSPFFDCCYELRGRGLRDATIIATVFGRPVVASGQMGKGAWLLVSDARLPLAGHVNPRLGGSHYGAATLATVLAHILDPEAIQEAR